MKKLTLTAVLGLAMVLPGLSMADTNSTTPLGLASASSSSHQGAQDNSMGSGSMGNMANGNQAAQGANDSATTGSAPAGSTSSNGSGTTGNSSSGQ